MSRVIFYCNDSLSNIESFEYYKQDIDALEALGHEVIVCNRYRDIPLKFDLLFVWWWTYALYPVLLARLLQRPVITTGTFNFKFPENFEGTDYFARPRWQRLVIRQAAKWSTLNLFVNRGELKACTGYFGLKGSRYYPHVIHNDYLQGPATNRTLTLFNLAWSGKKNLIRKGIPELLEAVSLIKAEFPALRLKIAGHVGDGVDFLGALIKQYGIADIVEWLGPLSRHDKIELLRACEIYVQPSHYEGFGLAMAEAMGSGACVITCDVGAVKDVVADCGVYVPPGSPQELAEAIRLVLSDRPLRHEFQSAAQKRAQVEFAFQAKIDRLAHYLREARMP